MELPINYTQVHFTVREQAREEYIKLQEGKCYLCRALLTESPPDDVLAKAVNKGLYPPNFFNSPIHLHHDHEAGMTLGAVHGYCNAVLWEYYGE